MTISRYLHHRKPPRLPVRAGIAREVAAILGKPLRMPAMDYKAVCEPDAPITVQVEAPDLCPRYMAHYVRNIRMGESPRWMKRHLALCGLRSISNVWISPTTPCWKWASPCTPLT